MNLGDTKMIVVMSIFFYYKVAKHIDNHLCDVYNNA